MKVSQGKVRFPLTLSDLLELQSRKIAIRIEIYENDTVAFLEADDDFFAEGRTIKEAKKNLAKSLEDELDFLDKHRDELGTDLREVSASAKRLAVKIRAISARKLRSLLLKLGFEEEAGKDHVFFYFRYGNKIVVRTKISHGAREIGQPVLGLIGKQLRLKGRNLEKLLRGELSSEDYIRILRELEVIK